MAANGSRVRKIVFPLQAVFPAAVLALYLVLWQVDPARTIMALRSSMSVLSHVLLPLCLVFLLMIGMNVFLRPPHFTKFMGKGTSIKRNLLSAAGGIISAGPIYAWYPMLKDLREKGVEHSLLAVFLVNRAVKPFLLPIMISFFGWTYVLALTLLTVGGSLCVGFVMGALLDSPIAPRHKGAD